MSWTVTALFAGVGNFVSLWYTCADAAAFFAKAFLVLSWAVAPLFVLGRWFFWGKHFSYFLVDVGAGGFLFFFLLLHLCYSWFKFLFDYSWNETQPISYGGSILL